MDTTDITQGWDLRDGIDPEPLRKVAAERAARKKDEAEQRNAEWSRKDKEARQKAEKQVEPFRRRLGELLGTDVPADAIRVAEVYPGYEITCRFAQVDEAREPRQDLECRASRESRGSAVHHRAPRRHPLAAAPERSRT